MMTLTVRTIERQRRFHGGGEHRDVKEPHRFR